jgi:hypothetical protein
MILLFILERVAMFRLNNVLRISKHIYNEL